MSDVFPSVLYALYDLRYKKITDQDVTDALQAAIDAAQDVALDVHKVNPDAHTVQNVMEPATNNTGRVGASGKNYAAGYFAALYLGGVAKSTWPSAVAGSNGEVILSGAVTLLGEDGVTVTHNKGDVNYLVKTNVTGLGNLGRIGDIAYVKAANTVVIYNSGISGISADVEISAVA